MSAAFVMEIDAGVDECKKKKRKRVEGVSRSNGRGVIMWLKCHARV